MSKDFLINENEMVMGKGVIHHFSMLIRDFAGKGHKDHLQSFPLKLRHLEGFYFGAFDKAKHDDEGTGCKSI